MRQHDQPKLELYRNSNARPLAGGVNNWRKKHCDNSGCCERQHVHGSKEMPDALHQCQKKTQWAERLRHVVLVKIGVAKKSSGSVMVVSQPDQQRHNGNQRNRSALESVATTVIVMRQDFPKCKCQRSDDSSLFAQDSQTKSKLAWPDAPLNVKADSPERKRGSSKIGMRQGALHKKDRIHGCGNGCGNSHAGTREPSREHEDVRESERSQKQHGYARYSGFPSTDGEP